MDVVPDDDGPGQGAGVAGVLDGRVRGAARALRTGRTAGIVLGSVDGRGLVGVAGGNSSRDALLRLTVHADGTASGPFVTSLEFMKARAHRLTWPDHTAYVTTWPGTTGTTLRPDQLADTDALHALSLAVPHVTHTLYTEDGGNPAGWWYSLTDHSWASVRWPAPQGPGIVHQHGPRHLWDAIESAYQ